ncbi:MAG: cyanoexosortase B [Cyanobacteria bacterium P01_F01_bin.53]
MLLSKNRFHLPIEGIVIALIGVLYGPLLWHWVDGWVSKSISIQHEYFSHGLLGIPFACFLVWERRSQWNALPFKAYWLAYPVLFAGAIFYNSNLLDLMNLSLPLMLTGLFLVLKGPAGLRLCFFPWVLLLLSTPTQLPYLLEPYMLPMQSFIAASAGFILLQFGVDVQVNGIYLSVSERLVEVAPHCVGLKMLFTSLYMGLILTYWTGLTRSRLRTGLFFVGIIGVSVMGNIIRNATLTYFHGSDMTGAFEWLHDSWGGDVYAALLLGALVVLVQMLEKYVPETLRLSDRSDRSNASSAPSSPANYF